jgi:hypothetical protein
VKPTPAWMLATVLACACAPLSDDAPCPAGEPIDAIVATPVLDAPCVLDPPAPTRLLLTTTDFSTGAVSLVELATASVERDVAATTTDSIPGWHDGLGVLVNRFQFDSVARLDPQRGWASAGIVPVESSCSVAPNPQAIAFGPDGLAYVTTLDVPEIAVLDLDAPAASARTGTIDLRAIEDEDGNPDAGVVVACGQTLWVAVQRLDASYSHVGPDELVPIDLAQRRVIDLDPRQDGAQGIRSGGAWLRQLRRDPTDPDGLHVLALSTGIERYDLAAGTATWLVAPEAFAAAGLGGPRQLQSFDVDDHGAIAFVAAYDEPPEQVQLYRVALDGGEPAIPVAFADDFDSVERSLELVGDRLWYGSTRRGAPGLWVFDTSVVPPVVVAGPLDTGLPPYSMVAIP